MDIKGVTTPSNPYIRTGSGKMFHAEPALNEICIEDIARGLSRAPRWNGQTVLPYCVAAHSIFVSRIVPREHRLCALLHDASEAYMADLPKPFKLLLPDYTRLENRIMTQISNRFGFDWPMNSTVHTADFSALLLEREALFELPFESDFPNDEVPSALLRDAEWDFYFWVRQTPAQMYVHFLDAFREVDHL